MINVTLDRVSSMTATLLLICKGEGETAAEREAALRTWLSAHEDTLLEALGDLLPYSYQYEFDPCCLDEDPPHAVVNYVIYPPAELGDYRSVSYKDYLLMPNGQILFLKEILSRCKVRIPEELLKTSIDNAMRDYRRQIKNSGKTFPQFLKENGLTEESLRKRAEASASWQIQFTSVFYAIGIDMGLRVTEEDRDRYLSKIAEQNGLPLELLKEKLIDLRGYDADIMHQKVMEKLTKA